MNLYVAVLNFLISVATGSSAPKSSGVKISDDAEEVINRNSKLMLVVLDLSVKCEVGLAFLQQGSLTLPY